MAIVSLLDRSMEIPSFEIRMKVLKDEQKIDVHMRGRKMQCIEGEKREKNRRTVQKFYSKCWMIKIIKKTRAILTSNFSHRICICHLFYDTDFSIFSTEKVCVEKSTQ